MTLASATTERLFGKYLGTVVDNQPPESNSAFQGEIKVRVGPILKEDGAPIEVWAKPCFPPGFFLIPELDTKVWVEFAAGDIDFPIWIGVLYPRGKLPKTANDEAPVTATKVIRTQSGHVLTFDDTAKQEQIVIRHRAGSRIEIDAQGKITIVDAGNDTSIVSTKINLGGRGEAAEPLVMGDTLKKKLEKLIQIVLTHHHPTGVGPSGPPVTSMKDLEELRDSLGEVLSTQNRTD